MELDKVFRKNFKNWRKKAGISQEKLAQLCNCAHSYIRQIECGSRFPSFAFIGKLANALGIAPYLLFFDENIDKREEIGVFKEIAYAESELMEMVSGDIKKIFENLKNRV